MHLILPDMLPIYVNSINKYIEYNKNEFGLLSKPFLAKNEANLRKSKRVSALHFVSRLQASSTQKTLNYSTIEELFSEEQEKIKKIRGEHAPGVYDDLLVIVIEHIWNCKIAESHLNNILNMQPDNKHLHQLLIDIFTYMCTLKFDEYMSSIPKLPSLHKWSGEDAIVIRDTVKIIINNIHSKIDKELINDPQILKIIEQLQGLKIIKDKNFNDKISELSSTLNSKKLDAPLIWQFSLNYNDNNSENEPNNPFCWRPVSASESDFELDEISSLFRCNSAPMLGMFNKLKVEKPLILTDQPKRRQLDSSPLHKKSRQLENNELARIPSFKL